MAAPGGPPASETIVAFLRRLIGDERLAVLSDADEGMLDALAVMLGDMRVLDIEPVPLGLLEELEGTDIVVDVGQDPAAGGPVATQFPLLTGWRERRYANVYDSVSVFRDRGNLWSHRFFTAAHVGNLRRTNQMGGQFTGDTTFVIGNFYMRSNVMPTIAPADADVVADAFMQGDRPVAIQMLRMFGHGPLHDAWLAWTHAAQVEFGLGDRPYFQASAYDLLSRPALMGPPSRGLRGPLLMEREPPLNVDPMRTEQAEEAAWHPAIARPIIIPVRQNFWATITPGDDEEAALRDVMPADREPLVWLHFEGLETRDIQ